MNWLRVSFLFALFLNGVGSCALAIAYPYFLVNANADSSLVFQMEAAIFLAAAFGLFFWGRILDSGRSIWRLKFGVILLEFLASLVFLLSVEYDLGYKIHGLFIALLEFLFAFELPWSRIAFLNLPSEKFEKKEESARKISMAATMITLLAPAIGAGMGGLSVKSMALINMMSAVPYMLICTYLGWNDQGSADKFIKKESIPLSKAIPHLSRWWFLLIGYAFMTLAPAAIMSALPLALSRSFNSKNDIIGFYFFSGILLSISGTKAVRDILRPFLRGRLATISLGLMIGSLVFVFSNNIFAKIIGYALHNIFWLGLSIDMTNALYSQELENARGRIFSIFQMVGKFSFPIVAGILSLFSNKYCLNGVVLIVGLSVAVGAVILSRSIFADVLMVKAEYPS